MCTAQVWIVQGYRKSLARLNHNTYRSGSVRAVFDKYRGRLNEPQQGQFRRARPTTHSFDRAQRASGKGGFGEMIGDGGRSSRIIELSTALMQADSSGSEHQDQDQHIARVILEVQSGQHLVILARVSSRRAQQQRSIPCITKPCRFARTSAKGSSSAPEHEHKLEERQEAVQPQSPFIFAYSIPSRVFPPAPPHPPHSGEYSAG